MLTLHYWNRGSRYKRGLIKFYKNYWWPFFLLLTRQIQYFSTITRNCMQLIPHTRWSSIKCRRNSKQSSRNAKQRSCSGAPERFPQFKDWSSNTIILFLYIMNLFLFIVSIRSENWKCRHYNLWTMYRLATLQIHETGMTQFITTCQTYATFKSI